MTKTCLEFQLCEMQIVTTANLAQRNTGGGERVYQLLPLFVKSELTCHCQVDYRDQEAFICYPAPHDFMRVHRTCGRATRFTVAYLYQTCDSCRSYYIPKVED